MLAKNIVGIIILILNIAGLGYVFYLGIVALMNYFFPKEEPVEEVNREPEPQRPQVVIDEDMIPDDDDLLKDMDLSDLDNLNLDDFD